jgi:hypothetical protein
MTLKQLIIIISIATAICWLTWAMVLFQVDPESGGLLGFGLFYASLFFSLLGSFFLLTFAVRRIFNKLELEYKIVATSFRQSFSFAILIDLILFLQSKNLLTWWNLVFVILALTIIEFFFVSYKGSSY